jgi:hypothetical protein
MACCSGTAGHSRSYIVEGVCEKTASGRYVSVLSACLGGER